jgi:hypothetical protein
MAERPPFEDCVEVGAGGVPCRREAEQQPGNQGDSEGKSEDG